MFQCACNAITPKNQPNQFIYAFYMFHMLQRALLAHWCGLICQVTSINEHTH